MEYQNSVSGSKNLKELNNNKSTVNESVNESINENKEKKVSNNEKLTLPNMVKDIIFFYIKHYYDKYLKEKNIIKMSDEQINTFIYENYNNRQKKIKKYIRDSLKKNLGSEYSGMAVENLLLEIFNDDDLAQERLRLEIKNYQKTKLS